MQFERRLATILSADVSGYCGLMGADDETTLSWLLKCRQIIEEIVARMNGRVFGVAGDSWMAEFASPVQAVRCAAECQRTVEALNEELPPAKQIRFRIGLHMGDVIVEEACLFGDEVNIAARLQELCRPGQLVLSDAVFRHVLGKADLRFKALGVRRLKNIAKDVSAFAAELRGQGAGGSPEDFLSALDVSMPVPGFDGRPAIAVLPCEPAGHGAASEHICEGLALDLINGLSNLRWLPVIGRASSFIFKGHALDLPTIGRALGARYLVTGTVLVAGQDLRLMVDLIDAGSGLNLWSQRYQLDFSKLFEVQDEIIASIVSRLGAEVERAEQSRSRERSLADLGSWELIRRGIWHLHKFTKEDAALARESFEEALRQDPGSAEARIQLAWWSFWDIWMKRTEVSGLEETARLAREALRIDPYDARAHLALGIALFMTKRLEQARHSLSAAIDLNPSLAAAHACLGSSYILGGEPEKAISPLLLAIRLNPHDPFTFHFLGELAMAFHMLGEWGKACEFAERSLQYRSGYWYAKAILIASLARSGRPAKAAALAAEPPCEFSAAQIDWVPFADGTWNAYLLDGLRLAGCTIAERD